MRGSMVLRVLAILVLIAIIFGGGYMAYNTGLSQGYAQGLAASGKGVTAPQAPVGPGPYPYYPGYWGWGPHFFFPFFPLFWIFGFFLIFGLLRLVFWGGRRRYGPYWHGDYPYGPHQEPGQPPQSGPQDTERPSDQR